MRCLLLPLAHCLGCGRPSPRHDRERPLPFCGRLLFFCHRVRPCGVERWQACKRHGRAPLKTFARRSCLQTSCADAAAVARAARMPLLRGFRRHALSYAGV
jgi:hypothetical protein